MTNEADGGRPHGDWSAVGSAFSALGDQMRSHFRKDATAAEEPKPEGQAFDDFRESVESAVSNLQAAIKDPSVDQAAKTASDSLLEALKTELDSSWGPTK